MKAYHLFIILIGFFISSCDKDSTIVEIEKNKLFASFFVEESDGYYNSDSSKFIIKKGLDINGELISESITQIESITINTIDVPVFDRYSIDRKNYGSIKFNKSSTFYLPYDEKIAVNLTTSVGNISGEIMMPDSLFDFSYRVRDSIYSEESISDTIVLGDTIYVSFKGKADTYILKANLFYDNLFQNQYEYISNSNEIMVDTKKMEKTGHLQISLIETLNGPFLKEGVKGNMQGDGSGFLYAKRVQWLPSIKYFYIVNSK